MANRESYPSSLFPLRGDVSAEKGAVAVVVTGLQTTPLATDTPTDQKKLVFDAATGKWTPKNVPLVGLQSNINSVMPLALGVMYFAYDTGNLFFGTPGYGPGYIQLGDTTAVNETLQQILLELRSMKVAIVALDNTLLPGDFDATSYTDQNVSESVVS